MRLFYFIGGPKPGQAVQYLRRLEEIGGNPPDWRVYPLVTSDGKALHLVRVDSPETIQVHLQSLAPYCEYSEINEIFD
jgi:hypothetical protein